MAFTTVVGGFEIASAVGTFLGLRQNHVNTEDGRFCQITAFLSISEGNLLRSLDDLIGFAEILDEDESKTMREFCDTVSVELRACRKIPIPKKRLQYFRKNPEYTQQLKRVQALAERSADLAVTVKEQSSDAALREAQRKRLEQQDQKAREARRNFLEDVEYYRKMQQSVSSNDSHDNVPVLKVAIAQGQAPAAGEQSANEHAQGPLPQDPFSDEASVAWAEHKALQGHA